MKHYGGFGVLAALSLTTTTGMAYNVLMCGATHLGIESNITMYIDRCQAPAGSSQDSDFQNAVYTWNVLQGVADRFTVSTTNSNCTQGNMQGNLRNDYQFNANLGGLAGLAWYTGYPTGTCSDGEWDVLIAQGQTAGVPPIATNGVYRRVVMTHELGHVLGAAHESTNGPPATMAPFQPGPVMGGSSAERSGVFGDDSNYARAYHSSGLTSNDLAASAWRRNGGAHDLPIPPNGGWQWGCAGATVSYTGTWTNKGTQALFGKKLYVYLSNDDIITNTDTLVQTWTINSNPGFTDTWSSSFAIPAGLPTYVNYKIGIIVDPLFEVSESNENNNYAFFYGTGVMRIPC